MTGAAILGLQGPRLLPDERAFFRDADPLGFILFARNVDTPDLLYRLTSELRDSLGRDAMVLIDQEGGRVQRMRSPHWREWLPPLDQVTAQPDPRAMWLRHRIMAAELRAVGIDANCAPTLDIAGDLTHPFLQNRCFGRTPDTIITQARAAADGLLAGGVLPIVKHMPGHGRAVSDSHKELPSVTATADALRDWDFRPFAALNDLPMGMSAHIRFTALDDAPATQSPAVLRLIREDIGFDGLLMTDDLSMEALSGTIGQRAAASIRAGCDVALYCKGELPESEAVMAAVGALTADAARRADAALTRRITPEPIDLPALDAEFGALVAEGANGRSV